MSGDGVSHIHKEGRAMIEVKEKRKFNYVVLVLLLVVIVGGVLLYLGVL
jgi:hypothetical protein